MKVQGYKILQERIDTMSEKIAGYENGLENSVSKKTANGYKRTVTLLEQLEMLAYDNNIIIDVSPKDNLGVIAEALVKALLGKGNAKALQGETDLVTGGRRFEIKLLIKGSSSYPSSLDLNTDEDVLIISNLGAFILRNEDIKEAYAKGYFKTKENKLKPTILGKDILTQTAFSERLTNDWGLNVWN